MLIWIITKSTIFCLWLASVCRPFILIFQFFNLLLHKHKINQIHWDGPFPIYILYTPRWICWSTNRSRPSCDDVVHFQKCIQKTDPTLYPRWPFLLKIYVFLIIKTSAFPWVIPWLILHKRVLCRSEFQDDHHHRTVLTSEPILRYWKGVYFLFYFF